MILKACLDSGATHPNPASGCARPLPDVDGQDMSWRLASGNGVLKIQIWSRQGEGTGSAGCGCGSGMNRYYNDMFSHSPAFFEIPISSPIGIPSYSVSARVTHNLQCARQARKGDVARSSRNVSVGMVLGQLYQYCYSKTRTRRPLHFCFRRSASV